jgi:peptidoglycan/xylan/chitin deacetylase (PgdA/CDA1 family)
MRLLAVNHHYYRDIRPPSGIYPITPAEFHQQSVTVSEAGWTLANERDTLFSESNVCLITFDDGLKEQVAAARWLHENGYWGIFFVPTLPIEARVVLDVHKLHMVRALRNDAQLAQDVTRGFGPSWTERVDLDRAKQTYKYDEDQAARLKFFLNFILSPDERNAWVSKIFADLVGSEAAASEALYMDVDDIRWLAERDMLGSHTHSHLPLATLTNEQIDFEIGHSVDVLRGIARRGLHYISYPYGSPDAVDERVVSAARKFNLSIGFTMFRGVNNDANACTLSFKRVNTNDVGEFL